MTVKPTYEALERRLMELEKIESKYKSSKEALRESENLFKMLYENAPLSYQSLDENGQFIVVNQTWLDTLGYTREEVIGKSFADFLHPDWQDHFKENFPRFKSIGEILGVEFEMVKKNGGLILVSLTGKISRDQTGAFQQTHCIFHDITEHKQTEEMQRHSNELMQYIIEHTNSAVAVHDRDLRYMYVSERYLKDYGIQGQDIIGMHHYDVFPDLPEKWREVHRKALAGEVSRSERDPYERADGTVEWTRWECRPWYEANGSINGIVVYTEVITERVKAEEALRESEHRHRILFEEALNPILLVDEDGHYIDANEAALQFMECDREDLMKRSVLDFAPPGTIERQKREHSPFAESRVLEADYLIHGRVKTLLLNVVPLEVEGRTVLCGIGQDITERKQAEASLIRQQRSIKLSSRIANVFLTSSRSEVYADVLDVLLKTLESRFGYFGYIDEAGDLISPSLTRDVWDQCQVTEKSIVFPRADWGGLWGRSLMEKQTMVSNENLWIPEGHVALQNAIATPIVHHNNLIGQFVLANKPGGYDKDDRDLLERAAAQTAPILFAIREEARQKAAHEKMEDQLRQAQKMETVGRLAGGVAHDFNNMLGVILGHTELALLQADETHELHDDLKEIQTAAKRSADITKQLLAFARKQTISPKQLDLNDTVESMLNMLRRLIGEDIDLVWKPAVHLWPVKMDPSQIDQILANLCVNARDAIDGVGKLTIETGKKSFNEEYCKEHLGFIPGDFVMLAVSDNGCGMDKDTLANLFEPFFTTKEVGKGTGLGLATVYGIVRQNNGFINVYSEPGQGSTFRIYLSRFFTDEHTDKVAPEKKATAGGTETILLVEDEPSILRMTRMMLERKGYTVLSAASPAEALEKADNHSGTIDLLMTDVVMPEMNGRDLAEQITALYPGIKLLFMSGYTANVIAHQGVLDDGVAFIQKPFSMGDMAEKVRTVLDTASNETQG